MLRPIIGLQRTSACGLAAEAGSFGVVKSVWRVSMAALGVVVLLGAKPVARSWRPLEFHLAEEKYAPGLIPMSIAGSAGAIYSGRLYLHANIELDERDVAKATVISDKFDCPVVELRLSKGGVAKINALAQGHKRSILAIVAAGKVVSAPQVFFERVGDTLEISSEFSAKEAARLADSINKKMSPTPNTGVQRMSLRATADAESLDNLK